MRYGIGDELNRERWEHDYIGMLEGGTNGAGYLMWAYSVSFDDGMIYYQLEDQGQKKRKLTQEELERERMKDSLNRVGFAILGGEILGGLGEIFPGGVGVTP